MKSRSDLSAIVIPLLAGLVWGGGVALLENLPYLIWGALYRPEWTWSTYLGLGLRALLYMMTVYGALFGLALGGAGLLLWVGQRWLRRPLGQSTLLAFSVGLALALTFGTAGRARLSGDPFLLLLIAIAAGLLFGVLGERVLRRRQRTRPEKTWLSPALLPRLALGLFALPLLAVLLIALSRNLLAELIRWPSTPTTPEKPNIILISIDALRADHLGAYGYDPRISPHLDALAREGVLFRQAFAQSSWTLPSVASFLTSLYPSELQVRCRQDFSLCYRQVDPMRTTIAEVMQEAGYRTHAYLASVWLQPHDGFLQGFDRAAFVWARAPFDRDFLEQSPLLRTVLSGPAMRAGFEWGYSLLFDPHLVPANRGERVNHYALRFLRRQPREPFFLWLYYMEPHAPYDPEQPFRPLPGEITPERERYLRSLEDTLLEAASPLDLTPTERAALVSLYDGNIVEVDRLVGEVIAELDRQGLRERTLVVVMADHGEEFYDHGGYSHGGTLYQEILHIPFIFWGSPVRVSGRVVETPVAALDLLPTLAEVAGGSIPAEARGRSLLPALQGEELEARPIYSEGLFRPPYDLQAVQYAGYKLISSPSSHRAELYDLHHDPTEQVDLSLQEPDRMAALMALLETWAAQTAQTARSLSRAAPPQTLDSAGFQELLREGGY